jgi:hypothetical protein
LAILKRPYVVSFVLASVLIIICLDTFNMQKAREVALFLCFWFGCLHAQRRVNTSPHQTFPDAKHDYRSRIAHSMTSLEVLSRLLLAGNSAAAFNLKRPNDFGSRAHIHHNRPAIIMETTPEGMESVVEFVGALWPSSDSGQKTGDVGKATALVETGAVDLSARFAGKTPLHYAALEGLVDLVRKIINAGAEVNAPTDLRGSEGVTALMWAATYGHEEVCKVLLDAGADPTLREKGGRNALEMAEDNNRHPLYKTAGVIALLKR